MIIKAFNLTYFLLMLLIAGIVIALTVLFKNKAQKSKERCVLAICAFNIFFFIIYKIGLAVGTPGLPDSYHFDIWLELPIHLCNISLFLVPIGVLTKNDKLMAYGFFIAPLGAFFAMTFPPEGFGGLNVFYFHMIGFYGTHAILIIVGILLVSMGLFRPSFRKIPLMFLTALILSSCAFVINILIREFTGSPANYFYTYDPEGISILELFWSILPVRYLYCSFAVIILAAYTCLTTLPFYLVDQKKLASKAK